MSLLVIRVGVVVFVFKGEVRPHCVGNPLLENEQMAPNRFNRGPLTPFHELYCPSRFYLMKSIFLVGWAFRFLIV